MRVSLIFVFMTIWSLASAQIVQEAQPYGSVLAAVAEAETNVIIMMSEPEPQLLSALTSIAPDLIEISESLEPTTEVTLETGEDKIYLIRGETPLPNEPTLSGLGIEIRTLPEDFPEALIIVDFKIVMAAIVPEEPSSLATYSWDIVTFEEPVEPVIGDFNVYWNAALP